MKNVVVILGSPRKGDSYDVCTDIGEKLKLHDVSLEYIELSKMNIKFCRGCNQCFTKMPGTCPIEDDLDMIIERMKNADGLILASPVYAYQVTALMKNFFDRIAYMTHRPIIVQKPFMTVVTTVGGGIKETDSYMKLMGRSLGGTHVGSVSVKAPQYFKKNDFIQIYNHNYFIKTQKHLLYCCDVITKAIKSDIVKKPTVADIFMFQAMKSKTYTSKVDYNYWAERGWLTQSYYMEEGVGLYKKALGKATGWIIERMWKRMVGRKLV